MQQESDVWVYIWGTNNYSSRKAYEIMKGRRKIDPSFKWFWNSYWQLKHNFFFWLLLRIELMLAVRGMLRRRTIHLDDYSCVFLLQPR